MSGLVSGSGLTIPWCSQYALLDAIGDYIEWDFTLSSGEADQLNIGDYLFSARVANLPPFDSHSTITINGIEIANSDNETSSAFFYAVDQLGWTWTAFGQFANPVSPFTTQSLNAFQSGANKIRWTLGAGHLNGQDDGTIIEPPKIDFLALEMVAIDTYGDRSAVGGLFFDYYIAQDENLFDVAVPLWIDTHTNPTYDHTSDDVPTGGSSHSQPTFLFRATDGAFGHVDPVTVFVDDVRRVSSNSPISDPVVFDIDVSVSAGGGEVTIEDQFYGFPFRPGFRILGRTTLSGGAGTIRLTLPLPTTPVGVFTPGGNFGIRYLGDATHYQRNRGFFGPLASSPQVTATPVQNSRYNFTITATINGDAHSELPIDVASGTDFPGTSRTVVYVIHEQIPTTWEWDNGIGGITSGTGVPPPITVDYPLHEEEYIAQVTTTGYWDDSNPSVSEAFISVNAVWGWLRFSSSRLLGGTFEAYDIPFVDAFDQFTQPNMAVQTTRTSGFVMLGYQNETRLDAFPPTGGSPTQDFILDAFADDPTHQNPSYPWCFDQDLVHVWTTFFTFADQGELLLYGPLGGTLITKANYSADPRRMFGFILDITMDPRTGHIFTLWDDSDGNIRIDELDTSANILHSCVLSGDFGTSGQIKGYIAAQNGIAYATAYKSNPPPTPDGIWVVNMATGAGSSGFAYSAGLGHPLTGIHVLDDTNSPLRQRQRDDGLANNGPRVATPGKNQPTSRQKSPRQGIKNTYL